MTLSDPFSSNGHLNNGVPLNGKGKGMSQSLPKRIYSWSPRTFVTTVVFAVIACFVPARFLFLVWSIAAELTALTLDMYGWLHRRSRSSVQEPNPKTPAGQELPKFTWQEVREHNTEQSLWLAIHGRVYDITTFLDKHPGGRHMLLFLAGRDVSNAFDAYHPFTDRPQKMMKSYLIGELKTHQYPPYKPDSGFYKECRRRVGEYFTKTGKDPKNPWPALWRMAVVYTVMATAYCICYIWADKVWWSARVAAGIVFGCGAGVTLVHWYHDGSHAALSHSPILWRFSTHFVDYVLGSSILSWNHQHVLGHHIHTNVIGVDPDIDQNFRRISPKQMWRRLFRYQHVFIPFVYLFLAVESRLVDGFLTTFIARKNGPMEINPPTTQDFLRNVSAKFFWIFYQLVVPLSFFSLPLGDTIILCLVMDLALGGWLTYNSQVSHIQDITFYKSDKDKPLSIVPEEWAIAQVKTCIDYAHGWKLDTFLSGALNYQTVHHLFPAVSQYHYPEIAPIVRDICAEYSVPYTHKPSFAAAFWDHLMHLKEMGEKGQVAELKID